MKKLYLISQNINKDWDTYDSAVVCADNEDEARNIHPSGFKLKYCNEYDWCNTEYVRVKYLGEAKEDLKIGVVCASYNAG